MLELIIKLLKLINIWNIIILISVSKNNLNKFILTLS